MDILLVCYIVGLEFYINVALDLYEWTVLQKLTKSWSRLYVLVFKVSYA